MTERYKVGDYLVVTKSHPPYFQSGDLVKVILAHNGDAAECFAKAVHNPYRNRGWFIRGRNIRPATPSEIQAATGLEMTDELSQAREHLRIAQEKLARLEAEQEEPWPQVGDMYWRVAPYGWERVEWTADSLDTQYQLLGLIAKTKQEAEQIYERQKIKQKVLARIAELNDGWEPDWHYGRDEKYFLWLNTHIRQFVVGVCSYKKGMPDSHYLKDRLCADALIEEFTTEQLKTALL